MKKTIFSLVTIMILGTAAMNGKVFTNTEDPGSDEQKQERPERKGGPRNGKGPRFEMIKSTDGCTCNTCVELRKREEMRQKRDSLRTEGKGQRPEKKN